MLKKGLTLLLACLLALSCCIGVFAADELTAEVNVDGTQLTISGTSVLKAGTTVTITVTKPGQNLENAGSGVLDSIALLVDETELDSVGSFNYVYALPEGMESGRYLVQAAVYGESHVRSIELDYKNVVQAKNAVDRLNDGESVRSVLDKYAKDFDVAAGLEYDACSETNKQYVSKFIESSKNGTWTEEKVAELLKSAIGQIDALATLKSLDRQKMKSFLEENHAALNIPDSTYTRYGVLTDAQKQMAIVYLANGIGNVSTPDELDALLADAVTKALSGSDSGNGGSSSVGGGPGGGSTGGNGNGNRVSSGVGVGQQTSGKPETTEPSGYTDMGTATWAEDAVRVLTNAGIVNGKGDGLFCPGETVTREEAVKMIVLGFGLTGSGDVTFADANEGAWYYTYIATAVECGVVSGMSDEYFGVGLPVTRQDMMVMLARAARAQGATVAAEREMSFTDQASIADYAAADVMEMANAGVISGRDDGRFDPTASATRAEAAQMCYHLFSKLALI